LLTEIGKVSIITGLLFMSAVLLPAGIDITVFPCTIVAVLVGWSQLTLLAPTKIIASLRGKKVLPLLVTGGVEKESGVLLKWTAIVVLADAVVTVKDKSSIIQIAKDRKENLCLIDIRAS